MGYADMYICTNVCLQILFCILYWFEVWQYEQEQNQLHIVLDLSNSLLLGQNLTISFNSPTEMVSSTTKVRVEMTQPSSLQNLVHRPQFYSPDRTRNILKYTGTNACTVTSVSNSKIAAKGHLTI